MKNLLLLRALQPFRSVHGRRKGVVGGGGGGGSPITDPYFSSVTLLLPLDGAHGSTTFTDYSPSPKTLTTIGSPSISTAQSKFGGASLSLSPNSALRQNQAGTEYQFGTGNLTIEKWIRPASPGSGNQALFDFNECQPFRLILGSNALFLQQSSSGTTVINSGSIAWTSGQWYHVALVRNGNEFRLYRDGVQIGSTWTTSASMDLSSSAPLFIGCNRGDTWFFSGHIDDFRITKGVARYTTAFTPPATAHPTA